MKRDSCNAGCRQKELLMLSKYVKFSGAAWLGNGYFTAVLISLLMEMNLRVPTNSRNYITTSWENPRRKMKLFTRIRIIHFGQWELALQKTGDFYSGNF